MAVAYSLGHGTATQQELLDRLSGASVVAVVDIRTAPGSRRSPHLSRAQLEQWLPAAGVGYRWEPRLGGFRRPAADSPDVVWRNDSFRGYAGHLRSPEAQAALARLGTEAHAEPVAFMCSETLWWRCHRRLVADALTLLHGFEVRHLMATGTTVHVPTAGVRVADGVLIYDAAAASETTQRG